LSLPSSKASGKPITPIRYRPTTQEGLYIRYKIYLTGINLTTIAKTLKVDATAVSKVTRGKRRSARIESEIAKILNKKSWNDVVLEARSEVQGKPVEVILQEIEQQMHNARKASAERMAQYITQNSERAERVIRKGLADKKKRRGA